IRRELDALEGQVERLRQRTHHKSLRQAGNADQKRVTTAKNGHQKLIKYRLLPNDHFADFGAHLLVSGAQAFQDVYVGLEIHGMILTQEGLLGSGRLLSLLSTGCMR